MKKIFLLLLFISTIAQAQIVNIPDANFKAKLLSASTSVPYAQNLNGDFFKIDANDNGEIELSEALQTRSLNIQNSFISSIEGIEYFTNLEYIDFRNNLITNVALNSLVSLNTLVLNNNLLSVLDLNSLINLKSLSCNNNDIVLLNINNLTLLESLDFSFNQLTNINLNNFPNLKNLNCSNNLLTSLNLSFCPFLIEVRCDNNLLSSINLDGLINLKNLYCSYNQLTNIDISDLVSLNGFACISNLLTTLDLNGPIFLFYLNCQNNLLTSLDYSNSNHLKSISFGNVGFNVTNFNTLNFPENVTSLSYFGGQQIEFDLSIFTNLTSLFITNSIVESIDVSQNFSLNNFAVLYNSNLNYVNIKNGLVNSFQVYVCPNLQYVCIDTDDAQNVINALNSANLNSVSVSTYCSFTPGGDYNTITGLVQYDFNQNGCDVLDFPANYTRIDVNLDGVSTNSSVFSNGVGVYNLYTSTTGVYNLVPNIENPSFFNVSPISADVPVMTIDNSVATQNFCITANGVHPDLEIVIAPIVPARPGFTAEYQIVYRNKGNQVMSQLYGVNFFYNQNLMSFVSATQVPSSIVSGGMSWDFANLLPFESRSINVIMQINAPTDTNPVNIGDVLEFTSSIMPMAGDESTVDNLFQLNQTVVGSYDPNDITCIEGDVVAPSYIGEYLHYVINFENTGTAPAENVVVKIEVNPNDFDINSLRILEASHNATIKITNNILEIIFQTIMLDTGGHGNVLLKVKSKENLVLNDIVTNNAKIYFDYNFPILTNDANTTFQTLSNSIPIKDLKIALYPNPTSSLLNIKAENRIKSVELYDVQGRIIQVNKVDSNEVLIDVSVYNSGIYFVKVTTDFGSQVEKIVKE